MSHGWEMTRRTALRGLGTAIALPFLDVMLPTLSAAPGAGTPRVGAERAEAQGVGTDRVGAQGVGG